MIPEYPSDPLPLRPSLPLWRWLRSYVTALLDVFFPPRCAGCGAPGVPLCTTCIGRFRPVTAPYCRICGQPLSHGNLCSPCRRGKFRHLVMARSAAHFTPPLREVIHAFKYKGQTHLAEPLAAYMVSRVRPHALHADLVIPVPLHPARHRRRGYNQATLLAHHLAHALHLPLHPDALVRVRNTPPQVTLGLRERQENVRGAFQCRDRQAVQGRRILLVDDVMTTGSTLEACADALAQAGAQRVLAYVLARATFAADRLPTA